MTVFKHPASGVVGNPRGPRLKGVEESLRERQSGVSEGTLAEAVEAGRSALIRYCERVSKGDDGLRPWFSKAMVESVLEAALPVLLGELVPRGDDGVSEVGTSGDGPSFGSKSCNDDGLSRCSCWFHEGTRRGSTEDDPCAVHPDDLVISDE